MKIVTITIAFWLLGSIWAKAQDRPASPPNNMSEIAAYSVYLSNYRNKDYESALKFGRWILLSMPKTIKGYPSFNLPINLDRFITIYAELAEKANDSTQKATYVDTVQTIFNNAFKEFSKSDINYFNWRVNQGRFYQEHIAILGKPALKKAVDAYLKAFELNPQKFVTSYKGYYPKVILSYFVNEGSDEAQNKAINFMKTAEAFADEELTNYFDTIRKKLFDKPIERIAYLKKQLQKKPDNIQVLQQLRDLYKGQNDLENAARISKHLYKIDPSYQNTVNLAKIASANGNYQLQIKYLKEAVTKTDKPENLKAIYFNIANALLNTEELQSAVEFAKKAIAVAPNWGRPYLTVAVIYAETVRQCAEGRTLTKEDKALYWLVVDYIQKAKQKDPSVADRANSLLQQYQPVTPTDQEIFFSKKWDDGTPIDISSLGRCYSWIDETTTVR